MKIKKTCDKFGKSDSELYTNHLFRCYPWRSSSKNTRVVVVDFWKSFGLCSVSPWRALSNDTIIYKSVLWLKYYSTKSTKFVHFSVYLRKVKKTSPFWSNVLKLTKLYWKSKKLAINLENLIQNHTNQVLPLETEFWILISSILLYNIN